ncbi:MAG: hypothetical protein JNK05_19735 [Myxococcales bacterium]|nr:hypothetical protein [Myxococcales bacterium]
MEERRIVVRAREADSIELTIARRPSAALATLLARCPACGAPCESDSTCDSCGHLHERARWRERRRPRTRMLTALINTPAGNYGVVAFVFIALATIVFRSGVDRSMLLSCAGAFLAASMLPALLLGLRAMGRQLVRRQWEYEAPDGAICVATGTLFRVERAVRIRTLCLGDCTVPESIDRIEPAHARALASDPIVTSRLPIAGGAISGSVRERTEAVIAVAIAIAKLARERRIRLVQNSFKQTTDTGGDRTTTVSSAFGVVALANAGEPGALGRWLLTAIPQDVTEDAGAYRTLGASAARPAEKAADLAAIFDRLLREAPTATWQTGEVVALARRKVSEEGGFVGEAPSLPVDFRQWLAELSGAVWSAMVEARSAASGVSA